MSTFACNSIPKTKKWENNKEINCQGYESSSHSICILIYSDIRT